MTAKIVNSAMDEIRTLGTDQTVRVELEDTLTALDAAMSWKDLMAAFPGKVELVGKTNDSDVHVVQHGKVEIVVTGAPETDNLLVTQVRTPTFFMFDFDDAGKPGKVEASRRPGEIRFTGHYDNEIVGAPEVKDGT